MVINRCKISGVIGGVVLVSVVSAIVYLQSATKQYCFALDFDGAPSLPGVFNLCVGSGDLSAADRYFDAVLEATPADAESLFGENETARRNGVENYLSFVGESMRDMQDLSADYAISISDGELAVGLSHVVGGEEKRFPVFLQVRDDGIKDVGGLSNKLIKSLVTKYAISGRLPLRVSELEWWINRLFSKRDQFYSNDDYTIYFFEGWKRIGIEQFEGSAVQSLVMKLWGKSPDRLQPEDFYPTGRSKEYFERYQKYLVDSAVELESVEVGYADLIQLDDRAVFIADYGGAFILLNLAVYEGRWTVYNPLKSGVMNRVVLEPGYHQMMRAR